MRRDLQRNVFRGMSMPFVPRTSGELFGCAQGVDPGHQLVQGGGCSAATRAELLPEGSDLVMSHAQVIHGAVGRRATAQLGEDTVRQRLDLPQFCFECVGRSLEPLKRIPRLEQPVGQGFCALDVLEAGIIKMVLEGDYELIIHERKRRIERSPADLRDRRRGRRLIGFIGGVIRVGPAAGSGEGQNRQENQIFHA